MKDNVSSKVKIQIFHVYKRANSIPFLCLFELNKRCWISRAMISYSKRMLKTKSTLPCVLQLKKTIHISVKVMFTSCVSTASTVRKSSTWATLSSRGRSAAPASTQTDPGIKMTQICSVFTSSLS